VTALDYNTLEGIETYLKDDLKGLNKLVEDRVEAGYTRHEHLNEFVILGTWYLDSCGNCMRIHNDLRKAGCSVPDVMTKAGMCSLVGYFACYMSRDIPPPHVSCPVCQEKWTLGNSFDVKTSNDDEVMPLTDFVGKPWAAVTAALSLREDAVYEPVLDCFIQNDKYIDLRPRSDYPTIKRNEKGFIGTRDEALDPKTHIIEKGDSGCFRVWKYFHRVCRVAHQKEVYVRHYTEILESAGIIGKITPITNAYTSDEDSGPWIEVETLFGKIRMGWRKRVINIDWPSKIDMTKEFESEGVTKGTSFIHAWGKPKAIEYLKKIQDKAISLLDRLTIEVNK
jgi:hypothetical protein